MKIKLLQFYLKIFGRTNFRKFNKFLLVLGLKGLGITNYQNSIISGEDYTLTEIRKILRNEKEPLIFDVGANIGKYSYLLRKILGGKARIYSFEPVKKTFEELKRKSKEIKNISYNFGFSDKKKEVQIYYSKKESKSPHASIYEDVINKIHIKESVGEKIKLERLDDFCKKNSIDKIDFLKIDVEGHEFAVLNGSQKMIKDGKIKIIQFEFNEMNLISRTNMLDFLEILKDYNLYRILTNSLIPIKPQNIENRIFLFQNILAVKK